MGQDSSVPIKAITSLVLKANSNSQIGALSLRIDSRNTERVSNTQFVGQFVGLFLDISALLFCPVHNGSQSYPWNGCLQVSHICFQNLYSSSIHFLVILHLSFTSTSKTGPFLCLRVIPQSRWKGTARANGGFPATYHLLVVFSNWNRQWEGLIGTIDK